MISIAIVNAIVQSKHRFYKKEKKKIIKERNGTVALTMSRAFTWCVASYLVS